MHLNSLKIDIYYTIERENSMEQSLQIWQDSHSVPDIERHDAEKNKVFNHTFLPIKDEWKEM